VHPLLRLQRTAGNNAVQHLLARRSVQAKLSVSQPGDPFEREADAVARAVVQGRSFPTVQSKCAACAAGLPCEKCGNKTVQRSATGTSVGDSDTTRAIGAIQSGGEALADPERQYFESALGRDFSDVRIHTHPAASAQARALGARAYTFGRDI